uniref:Uncharacterized protein n=2 Tax=unclassified Seunavirus TaxID=2494210 RepID=A0AAU8GE31_9CAUD
MLDYTNLWCVATLVSFYVAVGAVVAIYIMLEDR